MGVYIPKMKKPKCCGECLLCLDDGRIANGYCMIFHRHVNMTELDKNCPLIEIKTPHGRLVDEKELAIKIVESNYGVDFINKTTALIIDAPTVIEAEGE